MFAATRRWFRRNRTPLAIGVGVVGAGYVAAQYLLAKISDARERMSSERIAKENLRRRFEQNQEDCTFTVLALLPTVTTNVLEAMNTEAITYEIQHMKAAAPAAGAARSVKSEGAEAAAGAAGAAAAPARAPPSIADTLLTEDVADGGRSVVAAAAGGSSNSSSALPGDGAEGGVQASQEGQPGPAAAAATDAAGTEPQASTPAPTSAPLPPTKRKTKRQLWDELTISSITRAYTLLYTVSLLVLLTRIQLNLLGRRSYLSSVVSLATGRAQATISLENHDDDDDRLRQGGGGGSGGGAPLDNSLDFEVNRKYLAFSWWLLNRSWADVAQRVEAAVRAAFGHLSPRDHISLAEFADLTRQVRQAVEHGPVPTTTTAATATTTPSQRWLPLVLPPPGLEDFVLRASGILADSAEAAFETVPRPSEAGVESIASLPADAADAASPSASFFPPSSASALSTASPAEIAALRRMLDETADLVESPTFSHVLGLLLDAGFATLVERKVAPLVFDLPPAPFGEGGNRAGDDDGNGSAAAAEVLRLRHAKTVQLPKVLSVLTRQAHVIGSGMPNEYLHEMEAVRDLEAFAAVVYSSNWANEVLREDDGLAAAEAEKTPAQGQQPSASASASASASSPPSPAQPPASFSIGESAYSLVGESAVMVNPAASASAPPAAAATLSDLESAWARVVEGKE